MGEQLKLCMGCMSPKEGAVCPYCGYAEGTPSLPSYLRPETTLSGERYLVGRLLHYNGEGATYIGFDIVTSRRVLIKEYMPDALCRRVKNSSIISVGQNTLVPYKAFMSEFTELNKILAKMRSINHINPALDMFAENNTTYVVFDYVEGVTLQQYLQEKAGELSWDEVKQLFPPLFTTLSLVHNAGIVHRGISPETILVTDKGDLKLTEFCISAARTANTELAAEIFAGYAAPEQYSSSNWQGTWTDVYGISAVLYRALTGCMPTEAVSRIGNDNLCEPAQMNPNVPKNVSKVLMQGLSLSGDLRLQTITELVTKLFEQPDYLEQGLSSSRTFEQTIAIPKQGMHSSQEIPAAPVQARPGRKPPANNKMKRIRIPLLVFIIVVTILGIAALVALSMLSPPEEEGGTNGSAPGTSANTSMILETTTPPSTTPLSTVPTTQSPVKSEETFLVPSFLGKNYDLLKDSETYKDWLIFTSEPEYNEEYAKGQIFDQSIEEGKSVKKGTEIKVKVSQGPQYVEVPDYLGKNKDSYLAELGAAGIKYREEAVEDPSVLYGYVSRTSKEMGEKINVAEGEVLVVYYSTYLPIDDVDSSTETDFPVPLETDVTNN